MAKIAGITIYDKTFFIQLLFANLLLYPTMNHINLFLLVVLGDKALSTW